MGNGCDTSGGKNPLVVIGGGGDVRIPFMGGACVV